MPKTLLFLFRKKYEKNSTNKTTNEAGVVVDELLEFCAYRKVLQRVSIQ